MGLDDIPTLDLDTIDADLVKGIARGGRYYRRVPTGNPKRPWRYYYTKEEYDRDHGEAAHVSGRETAHHREREKSGEVRLSKKELLHKLKHGTYSIISAGRNPEHPDEKHLDVNDPKFEARHEELRSELQKRGMKYTEVIGHYGGKEKSFLVYHHDEARPDRSDGLGERAMMVHHESPSHFGAIRELGKKFNQDSVIHAHGGKNEMHFTVGPSAGKHHKGDGFEIKPHAEDFYTHTPTKRGATKFALNFEWDTYHGHEAAAHKSMFVISRERMLKGPAPKYISKKPDGKGGWIYSYADDGEKLKTPTKKAPFHIKTREGKEERTGVHLGDYALHREKGYGGMEYRLTHKPSGMSVDSSFHRGEAEALLHHFAEHGHGIGAEITADDHRKVIGVKKNFAHEFDHADAASYRHVKNMKKSAHRYIKRTPKPGGGYNYEYPEEQHQGSKRSDVQSPQAKTSSKTSSISGANLLAQATAAMKAKDYKSANALEERITHYLAHGAHDGVIQDEKALRQAWRKLNPGSTKEDLNNAIDRARGITRKSLTHYEQGEEMSMLESTTALREQIKMLMAQEDPMAKGLYAFEPGYGRQGMNKIPDDYLAAYLDAFIEEAYEHEKRECLHDENAAIMGISQPDGANGGIGGDAADWWSQWIMNELVIYCGKNENLMRACSKLNCTKAHVASRLRAMGLVKPSFNGSDVNGDFMEGYSFSEEQTAAGIGKSLTADGGAFPSEQELRKSVERTMGVLADDGEHVKLEDDNINPVQMLANVHHARFTLMQDVYGLDLGINPKR